MDIFLGLLSIEYSFVFAFLRKLQVKYLGTLGVKLTIHFNFIRINASNFSINNSCFYLVSRDVLSSLLIRTCLIGADAIWDALLTREADATIVDVDVEVVSDSSVFSPSFMSLL